MSGVPTVIEQVPEEQIVAPQEQGSKISFSSFLITGSTNFRPSTNSEAQEAGDCLNNALAQVFVEERLQEFILDKGGRPWNGENIKFVHIEYSSELGEKPKGMRIHFHAAVKIEHMVRLFVARPILRDMIDDELQALGPLSSGRQLRMYGIFVSGEGRGAGNYIRKQAPVRVSLQQHHNKILNQG